MILNFLGYLGNQGKFVLTPKAYELDTQTRWPPAGYSLLEKGEQKNDQNMCRAKKGRCHREKRVNPGRYAGRERQKC